MGDAASKTGPAASDAFLDHKHLYARVTQIKATEFVPKVTFDKDYEIAQRLKARGSTTTAPATPTTAWSSTSPRSTSSTGDLVAATVATLRRYRRRRQHHRLDRV